MGKYPTRASIIIKSPNSELIYVTTQKNIKKFGTRDARIGNDQVVVLEELKKDIGILFGVGHGRKSKIEDTGLLLEIKYLNWRR
jgi:hypothetical protein